MGFRQTAVYYDRLLRHTGKSRLVRLPERTRFMIWLTAAALILGLLFLGSKSFWVDEGATAYIVTASWPRLVALITSSHPTMSVYLVILHVWTSVAGTSEFAMRFPSAIFSTLTVPVLYALVAELFDRRIGAVAVVMMMVNLTAIGYAQEARSYALLVLLVTVSAWFFVRALRRPSIGNCAGYAVFGALGVTRICSQSWFCLRSGFRCGSSGRGAGR